MIVLLFSDGFESGFEICSNEQGQQQQSIDTEPQRLGINRSSSTTSDSSLSISSLASSISPTTTSKLNEKLNKIQQVYIEIACRYLHDEFGLTVGRRMFQNLVPLLFDLQKLCSTLANVNLCELAEDEDRSSYSSIPSTTASATSVTPIYSDHQISHTSPSQFNSTMISGRSHLNELQKENREPPPQPNILPTARSPFSSSSLSSSSVLSNTIPTYGNYQV
jgi:hypothetical protein